MPKLIEDLKAVRELLSVPERWTQGHYAINAAGGTVDEIDSGAICWCLVGAIRRVCGNSELRRFDAIRTLSKMANTVGIIVWQDAPNRTHAEVLALLDLAIAEAN